MSMLPSYPVAHTFTPESSSLHIRSKGETTKRFYTTD